MIPASPVTNLFSEDPGAEWRASSIGPQWAALRFPNLYTVTAVAVTVQPGPHVPREVQLEVAGGLEGPWRAVKTFSLPAQPGPGVELDIVTRAFTVHVGDFHATSQVGGGQQSEGLWWHRTHTRDLLAHNHNHNQKHKHKHTGILPPPPNDLARRQFWRLHVLRTHGSSPCAISHVRFFGFDALMPKWFAEHGMTKVCVGE